MDITQAQLNRLLNNIAEDINLLKEYEGSLRYEDDPKRKAKYKREIEQIKESLSNYQREYKELRMQNSEISYPALNDIENGLSQLHSKVDILMIEQKEIYEEISSLQLSILHRFDQSDQIIIRTITNQLDQMQLVTVQSILDALESNQFSESQAQETLSEINEMLVLARKERVSFPNQPAIEKFMADPTLDWKHRLRLTIPIIPLLLDYQVEYELKSGVNLPKFWEKMKQKIKGR